MLKVGQQIIVRFDTERKDGVEGHAVIVATYPTVQPDVTRWPATRDHIFCAVHFPRTRANIVRELGRHPHVGVYYRWIHKTQGDGGLD